MIFIANARAVGSPKRIGSDALLKLAEERMRRGLAPPSQIYRVENRQRIDWLQFPAWARPVDPQVYDGCCHEG